MTRQDDHHTVIGGTRAGKTAAMAAMLTAYAEQHPLGTATRWGPALLLAPGPTVIRGEVVRPVLDRAGRELRFDEQDCVCDHPPSQHNDGFGCTQETDGEPCPCLAGWSFGP